MVSHLTCCWRNTNLSTPPCPSYPVEIINILLMIYWISVCWKDPPNKWSFNGNKRQPQHIRKYKQQQRLLNKNHFGYSWHSVQQSSPPEARARERGSQQVPHWKKKSGRITDLSPLNAEGCKKDFWRDQSRLWAIQDHNKASMKGFISRGRAEAAPALWSLPAAFPIAHHFLPAQSSPPAPHVGPVLAS